eukprot:3584487-Amphidinium_carterae.2
MFPLGNLQPHLLCRCSNQLTDDTDWTTLASRRKTQHVESFLSKRAEQQGQTIGSVARMNCRASLQCAVVIFYSRQEFLPKPQTRSHTCPTQLSNRTYNIL